MRLVAFGKALLFCKYMKDTAQIRLYGEMDDMYCNYIAESIMYAAGNGAKDICIHINSMGGSLAGAYSILAAMKGASEAGAEVHTYADGFVFSAATVVFLAAPKANRHAYPQSTFMFHAASAEGQMPNGAAMQTINKGLRSAYLSLGIDEEVVNNWLNDAAGDSWYSSEEMNEMGYIGVMESNSMEMEKVEALYKVAASFGIAAMAKLNINSNLNMENDKLDALAAENAALKEQLAAIEAEKATKEAAEVEAIVEEAVEAGHIEDTVEAKANALFLCTANRNAFKAFLSFKSRAATTAPAGIINMIQANGTEAVDPRA